MLNGIYRGVITNNIDPAGMNRLYVSIPVLTGSHAMWAFPCITGPVPEVRNGDGVWIMFEGGDISYPIWMGFFGRTELAEPDKYPATTRFQWDYDTSVVMADPGAGKVRTSSALTDVSFSTLSSGGTDVSRIFARVRASDIFLFQQSDNADNWGRYKLTSAPKDNGSWWLFSVTQVESHGVVVAKNKTVVVEFTYGIGPL